MFIFSISPHASCLDQSHLSHELTIPSSFRKNPHHSAVSIKTVPQHSKFIQHIFPIWCKWASNNFSGVGSALKNCEPGPEEVYTVHYRAQLYPVVLSVGLLTAHDYSCWKACTRGWYIHTYIHTRDVWSRMWPCFKCIKLGLLNSFPSNASRSTW